MSVLPEQKTTKRKILLTTILVAAVLNQSAHCADGNTSGDTRPERATESTAEQAGLMQIRLKVNGKIITATMLDNATAREFISLLPMTLTLEDYAATEKIAYLPRKLSTAGAPAGIDPSTGDITYYAPWGNLAIFYRDFGYSKGLVSLGRIDDGVEALEVPGSVKATIELAR